MLGSPLAQGQSYFVKSITSGYRLEFGSRTARRCRPTLARTMNTPHTPAPTALDADPASAQHGYVSGQMRPHFEALFAEHAARNAQALQQPGWLLDQPYGTHPRQTLDLLRGPGPRQGTLVYLHAGYWQSRDKSQFRFLAPAWQALGWDVALVNYPLCPEVTVTDIVASAALALEQVLTRQAQHAQASGQPPGALVLCGHSAGGQLVTELALQQAQQAQAFAQPIAGVVAVSGVFDLRPLVHTSLNERLGLDAASAQAASPLLRVRAGAAPGLWLWGEAETPAFHAQSLAMAERWCAQGNATQAHAVPGADHFTVLSALAEPEGVFARQLQAWARTARL